MARIAFEDVHLALDGRPVFAGLSLSLTEDRIALIGRNGAGKSQALRLMAGLSAPDRGRVRLDGIDPARDRKAALGAVGVLFQNPDHQIIFPTVDEELAFGLLAQGLTKAEAAAKAKAILARFGRAAWAGRRVQALSQGQRQLLCLMAVLAMEPRTILLDEPFSGLDLAVVLHLRGILAALPQQIVHVTHDLDAAAAADRVIWIDAGQVMADGAPAPVIADYRAAMAERAADAGADL